MGVLSFSGLLPVSTPPTPLMVGLTVDAPLLGLNEQPVEAADSGWQSAWTMPSREREGERGREREREGGRGREGVRE
jgi:hypothetical protein